MAIQRTTAQTAFTQQASDRVPAGAVARKLPLWAQRLDRTMTSLHDVVWPSSPEDGLRQSIALADLGWRQIFDRLRVMHQGVSQQELNDHAYRFVCEWQRMRAQLTFPRS